MTYFSRLTDIVTCNLTELLKQAADPVQAIDQIVAEMEEGVSGARRSVATAAANEERLTREIDEHRSQALHWMTTAKTHLAAKQEADARGALLRKKEVDDLIAGLEQQHQAARTTHDYLATMQRALEARHADACRRQLALKSGQPLEQEPSQIDQACAPFTNDHDAQIDAELEALRKELGA